MRIDYQSAAETMMLAQVKSRVVGTPYVWKNVVWLFLTKTKHDKALPSHNNGKIWLHSTVPCLSK